MIKGVKLKFKIMNIESKINNIDTWEWWRNQSINKWLNVNDIPSSIFWSIWNLKIESSEVLMHPYSAKYKKRFN